MNKQQKKEYNKQWRLDNKEHIRKYNKQYSLKYSLSNKSFHEVLNSILNKSNYLAN